MKSSIKYISFALLLLALASSCKRDDTSDGMGPIELQISIGEKTRAFLSSGNLELPGSTVAVHDDLTEFSGTIDGTTYTAADVAPYIDDYLYYDAGEGKWLFGSGNAWRWTRSGKHHFYAWLTADGDSSLGAEDLFGTSNPSWNATSRTLTVPALTLKSSSPQFDFCYSGFVAASSNPVVIQMQHYFSALALTVENKSSAPVTIESITVPDLPNATTSAAVIDYSNPTGTVGLDRPVPQTGAEPFFTNAFAGGLVLDKMGDPNSKRNVYTGAVVTSESEPDYRLVHPAAASVLSPSSSPAASSDSLIRISYSFDMTVAGHTETYHRQNVGIKMPNIDWTPGRRIALNITINEKVIELTFDVLDWDFNQYSLEFSNETATVTDELRFDETTYNTSSSTNRDIYTNGANPVKAKFRITNPVGAKIYVAPLGDTSFFNISVTGGGTTDPASVNPAENNGEVTVTFTPDTSHGTPTETKRLKFNFYLVNGTRETNIDSEVVQGKTYTIVWAN